MRAVFYADPDEHTPAFPANILIIKYKGGKSMKYCIPCPPPCCAAGFEKIIYGPAGATGATGVTGATGATEQVTYGKQSKSYSVKVRQSKRAAVMHIKSERHHIHTTKKGGDCIIFVMRMQISYQQF